MSRIPQTFIDDLLDRADIVELVGSRLDLRKTGKNYSARCPFHDEKTPSFTVSPDKQFYYCFGCGAGGNAIGFVMDYDRLEFPQAVELLANQFGLEVPKEDRFEDAMAGQRKKLHGIIDAASRYYRNQLRQHPEARQAVDYLQNRGLTGQIARTFAIGYAPPGWDNLLRALGTDDAQKALLKEAGLVVDRDDEGNRVYDRFRNRIMFPIRTSRGTTIGFGGRVLGDDKPKYLNSPETAVFHKGRELYGLYEALQTLKEIPRLLVVEGYMDVVALAQHGIANSVATLGTAATPEHLEKLYRYTSEVVFCFDGDQAGRAAARRALDTCLPVMSDGRAARFLFLPDAEDPDTLVRKVGPEEFGRLVKSAKSLSDFLFDTVGEGLDLNSLDDRSRLSKLAAPRISRMPAGVYRQLMFKQLARLTGMEVGELERLISAPQEPPLESETAGEVPPDWSGLPPDYYEELATADSADRTYERGQADHQANRQAGRYAERQFRATRPERTRKPRLRPAQQLVALLTQQPELRHQIPDLKPLRELEDDPDISLLLALLSLLAEHPDYTLNHILGYWRGVHGAEQGELLARIAANDLYQTQPDTVRDNLAEFNDICQHLLRRAQMRLPHRQRLLEILAQESISADERKTLFDIWHQRLSAEERTPELNAQIKQALARPAASDYK